MEQCIPDLPSTCKQLENWTKYLKQLFSGLGKHMQYRNVLSEWMKTNDLYKAICILPGVTFQTCTGKGKPRKHGGLCVEDTGIRLWESGGGFNLWGTVPELWELRREDPGMCRGVSLRPLLGGEVQCVEWNAAWLEPTSVTRELLSQTIPRTYV